MLNNPDVMPKGERKVSRTVTVAQEEISRDLSVFPVLPPTDAPTYENKLMVARKAVGLSAACGENENKEPPLHLLRV